MKQDSLGSGSLGYFVAISAIGLIIGLAWYLLPVFIAGNVFDLVTLIVVIFVSPTATLFGTIFFEILGDIG